MIYARFLLCFISNTAICCIKEAHESQPLIFPWFNRLQSASYISCLARVSCSRSISNITPSTRFVLKEFYPKRPSWDFEVGWGEGMGILGI